MYSGTRVQTAQLGPVLLDKSATLLVKITWQLLQLNLDKHIKSELEQETTGAGVFSQNHLQLKQALYQIKSKLRKLPLTLILVAYSLIGLNHTKIQILFLSIELRLSVQMVAGRRSVMEQNSQRWI